MPLTENEEFKTLERLSRMQDLMDLNEFMQDDELAECMELALKIIAKPDLPPAAAKIALVRFQAFSLKLKAMGQVYMTIKKGPSGGPNNNKKNVYLSMANECHEMAQSLKYVFKDSL